MIIFDFFDTKGRMVDENSLLYHYTSLDTLNAMLLEDADFYCTHFQALNDDSEIEIGMIITEKYLQEKFGWSSNGCVLFREVFKAILDDYQFGVPWIMSFSKEKDSLNQWGMYTDRIKGGVAIGFHVGQIWSAIDRFPGCYSKNALKSNGDKGDMSAFELRLLPCLYVESDVELIKELLETCLSIHEKELQRIGSARTIKDLQLTDFHDAITSILQVCTVIKHEAFKNEKEVRLILLPKIKNIDDCELIGGKPRWKTYVRQTRYEGFGSPIRKPLRGMIKEVVISPHGDVGMLWRTIRFLLNKYKMNWCALEKSVLPYNGR